MKRFLYSTIGILGTSLFPAIAFAQAGGTTTPPATTPPTTTVKTPSSYFDPGGNIQKNSGLPATTITDYVFNIISAGLGILAVVALVLILYAGFTIMTSAGNEDKIATGRQTLIWSVVGLLIIFSSFSILLLFDQVI